MKQTNSLVNYIADYTAKYSEQLSMEPPFIWFTTREVKDAPIDWTKGRRTSAYRYYGIAFRGANAMFINVRLHDGRSKIKDTVAHELVHFRFPYLSHGDEFRKKIKQIIGGKQFPPYKGDVKRGGSCCHEGGGMNEC